MNQFELKFYREWYDAISELSRDDRAAVALALLEYVYDDIVPEDQFIRIVTVLMRNRIDREKSRSVAPRRKPSVSEEPQESEKSTSSTSSSILPTSSSNEESSSSILTTSSSKQESSTSTSTTSPSPEAASPSQFCPQCADGKSAEAAPSSTNAVLEKYISTYYSPDSESFMRICKKNNIDPGPVMANARKVVANWLRENPGQPLPILERLPGSKMLPIDRSAFTLS